MSICSAGLTGEGVESTNIGTPYLRELIPSAPEGREGGGKKAET